MASYDVIWRVDFEGGSPEEAAQFAYDLLYEEGETPWCFEVIVPSTGRKKTIEVGPEGVVP